MSVYHSIFQARQHFAQVCRLQPRAATGWLEWSKMDEENGKIRVALEILLLGLKVCPANEMLLTKVRNWRVYVVMVWMGVLCACCVLMSEPRKSQRPITALFTLLT